MSDVTLSYAMCPYDTVIPLITGEVKPVGVTLQYQGMPGGIGGVFYDQLKFQRYDLAELSLSSYLVSRPQGYPFRLLPAFFNRNFFYTDVVVSKASGIRQDHPEDLKGKRFGVLDYQQTAALWIRGILQHEFGVRPQDLTWYQTRSKAFSHTGASGGKPPADVKLKYANAGFLTLLLQGGVDATMNAGFHLHSSVDRPDASIKDNPNFMTLFSDPKAEACRYVTKTGIYPPHHAAVVRESVLEKHPWVALSLMEAFERSKKLAMERAREFPPSLLVFGARLQREVDQVFGPDPYPYGLKANAKAIDAVQTMSLEQGLTQRKQPLNEIFPEELLIAEERNH